MEENTNKHSISIKDRYLSFVLEDEKYGVEILSVKEIIALQRIVPIPKTPNYVKGVMNLRGVIIPIIDLRLKLGMDEKEPEMHTAIIILKIHTIDVGFIVDEVNEVLAINQSELSSAPALGSNVNIDLIKSMAQVKGEVIMVLDMEKVFDQQEVATMQSLAKKPEAEPELELETVEE